MAPPPQPPQQAVVQPAADNNEARDYTYNDLHSDTALHGYPLHSESTTTSSGPPANQPANQQPPPANHQPVAPPPVSAPPVVAEPPANQALPPMGYEQPVGYFQANNPNMAELKSSNDPEEDDVPVVAAYSVLGSSNNKDEEEPRRSRADSNSRVSTERTTRPPLDRVRPDLRDPATRAPIVSHDQDPTPVNKIPSQVR